MTANQTIDGVPRELLERVFAWVERANERNGNGDIAEYLEMRALLDAPAAQPQDEPVAWMQPNQGGMCISNEVKQHSIKLGGAPASAVAGYSIPLYAEQPAPVAVVLPERLQQVLKFLDGAENLDGHWFGEPGPTGQIYWWRNELRKALAETNLFANQL